MPRALLYLWPYRDPAFRRDDTRSMAIYAGASFAFLIAIVLVLSQLSLRVAPVFWSWWSLAVIGLALAFAADWLRNSRDTLIVQALYNAGRILFWFGLFTAMLNLLGLQ
jgi:hypothetical protein